MEVEVREVGDFLAAHPPFDGLPREALTRLANTCTVRYVRRGETVPLSPRAGDGLAVVRAGAVDLVAAGGARAVRVGVGGTLGPSSPPADETTDPPRIAAEDTLLLVLPRAVLADLLPTYPAVDHTGGRSAERDRVVPPAGVPVRVVPPRTLLARIRLRHMLGRLRPRHAPPGPGDYPSGPVRALAATPVAEHTAVADVEFLAVDLETTGLDPAKDHIVAMGWVLVRGRDVALGSTREVLVRPPAGALVGESVAIHGLTDEMLAEAPTLREVLPALLDDLRGRVLVAHHAPFDVAFLTRAAEQVWGCGLPLTSVDTLGLQRRLVPLKDPPRGTHRLGAARRRHGLPDYPPHRASVDALAAGELLLAQIAALQEGRRRTLRLSDLGPLRSR